MLTLVQIAAVVLVVLLVIAVARMTRTREDRSERPQPVPEAAGGSEPMRPRRDGSGFGITRVYDAPGKHAAQDHPLPYRAPSPAPPALHPDRVSAAVPVAARFASSPAAAARAPGWDGVPVRGGQDGMVSVGSRFPDPPAGTDVELQDLALGLRDRAMALEAERQAQRTEIEQLRAALAEVAREVEALRAVRVEVDSGLAPAPEPKLPNVNIYELRPARRR